MRAAFFATFVAAALAQTKCQTSRDHAAAGAPYVPQCDETGAFLHKQCDSHGTMCWCVDPHSGDFVEKALPDCVPIRDHARPLCLSARMEATGALGEYVPQCAEDGSYAPKQCHGSTGRCWCVDPMTGEELNVELSACGPLDTVAPASCEEMRKKASETGLLGVYIPQCEEDGSFRAKQCHGSTGRCWCADPMTGEELDVELSACEPLDTTAPASCEEMRKEASGRLGAFVPQCEEDGTFSAKQCHGSIGRCWCADAMTGEELDIELSACEPLDTPCEEMRKEASGRLGAFVPQCEKDGTFSVKQCHGSIGRCWCADPISGEELDIELSACEPLDTIAPASCEGMRKEASGRLGAYVPQCEEDGTFSVKQCHGSIGRCWCVDPMTGEELDIELSACEPLDTLELPPCEEMRKEASGRPGAFVPRCEEDGTFSVKQCHGSTGRCWCADPMTGEELDIELSACEPLDITTPASCQRMRKEASGRLGAFVPQCEEDGTFSAKQCHGSIGRCWCADPMTGEELDVELSACEPLDTDEITPCKDMQKEASGRLGAFVPQCEEDGTFSAKQCYGSTGRCWCADPMTGEELDIELPECEPQMATACETIRNEASGRPGAYVPQCEADGSFSPKQCHGSIGRCWCADTVTGVEITDDLTACTEEPAIEEPPLDCAALLADVISRGLVGAFVPTCAEDGSFQGLQCWGSTGSCWCVDRAGVKTTDDISACAPCLHVGRAMAAAGMRPGAMLPTCRADGTYAARQCYGSTGECWCADRTTGEPIEGAQLSDCPEPVLVGKSAAEDPTCRELRASMLPKHRVGQWLPQCTADGNYRKRQCEGVGGRCWCVEVVTGAYAEIDDCDLPEPTAGPEGSLAGLPCPEAHDTAASWGVRGVHIPQCTESGLYEVRQCASQECWCVDEVTGQKLGTDLTACEMPEQTNIPDAHVGIGNTPMQCAVALEQALSLNSMGHYIPQCEATGLYNQRQCDGDFCWCVDVETGVKSSLDLTECDVEVVGYTPCADAKTVEMARMRFDVFVPVCTSDGGYQRKQCQPLGGDCWCVEALTGRRTDEPLAACGVCAVAAEAANDPNLMDAEAPRCREDGTYADLQCSGWTGACWCVDRYSGVGVPCEHNTGPQTASGGSVNISGSSASGGSSGSGTGNAAGISVFALAASIFALAAVGAAGFVLRRKASATQPDLDVMTAEDEVPLAS